LKPFFVEAVDIIKERSDELFENNGSNLEKWPSWAALSSGTTNARNKRRWYYKQSPSRPWVLRWTGRLQDDVTKTASDTEWGLKFNAPYAWFHHKWGGKLPKRRLIDLNNKTNEKIVKALQKLIHTQLQIFGRQR
jgi:phage gpG-like protein